MEQSIVPESARSIPPEDQHKLEDAKRRVAALKGFYVHLAVFLALNIGLAAINVVTGGEWWVHWVVLGWGIGVIAHALAVFGPQSKFVADWEVRKVQQFLNQR